MAGTGIEKQQLYFIRYETPTGLGKGVIIGTRNSSIKTILELLIGGVDSFSFGPVTIHHVKSKSAKARLKRMHGGKKYPAM